MLTGELKTFSEQYVRANFRAKCEWNPLRSGKLCLPHGFARDVSFCRYFLDCHANSRGCDGGDPATAMKMLESSHGLPSEAEYPYASAFPHCFACEVCCKAHRLRVPQVLWQFLQELVSVTRQHCWGQRVQSGEGACDGGRNHVRHETGVNCDTLALSLHHACALGSTLVVGSVFSSPSSQATAGPTSCNTAQCQSASTPDTCSTTAGTLWHSPGCAPLLP